MEDRPAPDDRIPKVVLNHKASNWIKNMAIPQKPISIIYNERPKIIPPVNPAALKYRATHRIVELAAPKSKKLKYMERPEVIEMVNKNVGKEKVSVDPKIQALIYEKNRT